MGNPSYDKRSSPPSSGFSLFEEWPCETEGANIPLVPSRERSTQGGGYGRGGLDTHHPFRSGRGLLATLSGFLRQGREETALVAARRYSLGPVQPTPEPGYRSRGRIVHGSGTLSARLHLQNPADRA